MRQSGFHKFNDNNFDRRFKQHQRGFGLIFVASAGLIGLMFVFIIAFYVGYGVIAYKAFNYVEQNGLKAIIERVWEGSENKETL